MKRTPLAKRIKRRISARPHRFFAVCPPGLTRLCSREVAALSCKIKQSGQLAEQVAFENITTIAGGVEFTSTVQGCYAANLYLRSPSRILMRIEKFRAENFRTFEKKFGEIEWELYLKPLTQINCEVSTTTSRLYHTDAIAQRASNAIKNRFIERVAHEISYATSSSSDIGSNQKGSSNIDSAQIDTVDIVSQDICPENNRSVEINQTHQTIMIRGEDDLFEISLDSSGELLHKRGLKRNVGTAPLRETIAFAILSAMNYPSADLNSNCNLKSDCFSSSRNEKLPLIDGMCGSGTFSLEAAMISNNIPAGLFRRFAFEDWLCFSNNQWCYMKKKATESILNPDNTGNKPHLFAIDKDASILEGLKKTVDKFNLSALISIVQSDFFNILPENLTQCGNKGFVVLNPPYGKRIGEKKDAEKIFVDIGKKLKSDFKGWRVGIIIPERRVLNHFNGVKMLLPIFHGGLEIDAAIIDC